MFDNNLKGCIEDLDMTQKELGSLFGVSRSAVKNWENGYYAIPIIQLIKFCDMFDFSLDYAMGIIRRNIKYGHFSVNNIIVSKRLKEFRKSLKISQQVLCDKCKIAQTTYSGYERGKYLINTTNLYYLCKTFDISMDYLIGRIDNPKVNKEKETTKI